MHGTAQVHRLKLLDTADAGKQTRSEAGVISAETPSGADGGASPRGGAQPGASAAAPAGGLPAASAAPGAGLGAGENAHASMPEGYSILHQPTPPVLVSRILERTHGAESGL